MGLLFVLEGEEQAKGPCVDISMAAHAAAIEVAKAEGSGRYPLLRRTNRFYADVLYEADEVRELMTELVALNSTAQSSELRQLIKLCELARSKQHGIEAIAD